MYYFIGFISLLLVGCSVSQNTENSPVAKAFIDNKLVPDIIDVAPEGYISVNYSNVEVNLGNKINPLQTLLQPIVGYNADANKLYTLMFFGPDLPIDLIPRYTQFLHWLIVNIPGEDYESGDTVSNFILARPHLDVVGFKNKYNLTGPVSGNFMRQAYLAPRQIKSLLSSTTP